MNEEFYEMVDNAVDAVFQKDMYLLRAYPYFQHTNTTKKQVREFIESDTAKNLALTISDLDAYIKGGSDREHDMLRVAYGYLGKPKARNIRTYLHNILKDALQYEIDRKPGRKKSSVKGRKKRSK